MKRVLSVLGVHIPRSLVLGSAFSQLVACLPSLSVASKAGEGAWGLLTQLPGRAPGPLPLLAASPWGRWARVPVIISFTDLMLPRGLCGPECPLVVGTCGHLSPAPSGTDASPLCPQRLLGPDSSGRRCDCIFSAPGGAASVGTGRPQLGSAWEARAFFVVGSE